MNKEFLKYNTKWLFLFTLAFVGAMFIITLFVGIFTKDIVYAFSNANIEFRSYLIFLTMLLTGICFRETVTKEFKDIIYSLPISKKKYFDLLLVKTLIITAIPFIYFIIIELMDFAIYVPVANLQSSVYIFIAFLIPTFLIITMMIFVVSISACVVPMLTMIIFVFLTYQNSGYEYDFNNLKPTTLGGMLIISVILLSVSRKLFEYRSAERIGKLFMFRWVEIMFASTASSLIGFIITGIIGNMFFLNIFMSRATNIQVINNSYSLGVLGNLIAILVMIASYIIIDSFFVKSFSKENISKNLKFLLIPIIMYFGWLLLFAMSFGGV